MSRTNSGILRLEWVSSIGALTPRMSTRPVTSAKLADAHSVLFNGLSSGADVPGGSVTSGVLGSASRTVCDDALPDLVVNWLAYGGLNGYRWDVF
jgi:hypothetical protein